MKIKIFLLLLLTGFAGCYVPEELPLLSPLKSADSVSRQYIGYLLKGQPDSCNLMLASGSATDSLKMAQEYASRSLKGGVVKKVKRVAENGTVWSAGSSGPSTRYQMGYEYEIEPQGYVLFFISLTKENDKLVVTSFNGRQTQLPVSEMTKFTLAHHTFGQLIFLVLSLAVPLFVIATFIAMLLSRMTAKKKILWSFLILLISLPQFTMDWGTGQVKWYLFNFSIFGGGFSKSSLVSYWTFFFNVPVFAIIFWYKRKGLAIPTAADATPPETPTTAEDDTYTTGTDETTGAQQQT